MILLKQLLVQETPGHGAVSPGSVCGLLWEGSGGHCRCLLRVSQPWLCRATEQQLFGKVFLPH